MNNSSNNSSNLTNLFKTLSNNPSFSLCSNTSSENNIIFNEIEQVFSRNIEDNIDSYYENFFNE